MAILTAVKGIKKDGKTVVAGYKIAFPKIEMEKCGFKAGDELTITYKEGEVRISRK